VEFLKRLLPAANPDFDHRIREVQYWWVEVNDQGQPQREIAFAKNGQAIAAMPLGRNYGFWTDSQMVFEASGYEEVTYSDFERQWSIVESRNT
jgi:hypothetical protein